MKLFNKTIDRQLFKQYPLGSDLSKQEVVVKIFNPYGNGTWFILNSDPEDPEYLWAIVDLGYGAEVGSVGRSELENYRNRMGWGFERDLSFDPVNAEELYKGLRNGEFYAKGGGVDSSEENTFDKIFLHYGFTKKRGAYGVRPYEHKKLGTYAQIDDKTRSIEIETPDDEYKGGYSVKGVIEFLKSKGFEETGSYADGGKVSKKETEVWGYVKSNGDLYYFSSHNRGLEDLMMYEKIDVIQINDYDGGKDFFLGYGSKSRVNGITEKKSDGRLFFGKWNKGFVDNENYPKGNMLSRHKIKYEDGGDIENFSDNQRMIMNQNVEVEHHHEELEDILEDEIPVPAWVVAKMETATQNLSDITHYLDGQKELAEDEKEEENEDQDEIENKEVVEPINVSAGTKAEITKKFTDDAWGNLKGFLKGMEGIDLRDDYTFDYKDEQFEVEPIINSDENGVSNAVFSIFDGDGEEVGEVAYSREGGKQKFTANSDYFQWNDAKFEDGGYFDGTIPNVSTYMSTYAKGGEVAKAEILGLSKNIMGTTDIEMKISGMRKSQDFIVYPISKDDTDKIITIQSSTRIGKIDLSTGRGLMSQSHSNGAYFVHFQMDKLTPFTVSESDLEDIKAHIFRTAGSSVGTRGIVSDNSGASGVYAKGGVTYYKNENERLSRPKSDMEEEVFEKVKSQINPDLFVGNFGWKTPMNKTAYGYLYALDDFDKKLVKSVKLKQGEVIFRYVTRITAISGMMPFVKTNVEKNLLYFPVINKLNEDEVVFETRGTNPLWLSLIEGSFAKGGGVGDNVLGLVKGDIFEVIDTEHTVTGNKFVFLDYEDKYGTIALKAIPYPPMLFKKLNDKDKIVYITDISSDGIKKLSDDKSGEILVRRYKRYIEYNMEQGGGIGFIPMDLEETLRITAKWGGTDIKGVIGILNAMIDSGLTDEDLKPRPTKSGTAHQNAIEKKTNELWAKIEPQYKGDLKGNMPYGTVRRLVDRANSSDDILKRFKPFRKNQKDSFADGGFMSDVYAKGGATKTFEYVPYAFVYRELDDPDFLPERYSPEEVEEFIQDWNRDMGTDYKNWEDFNKGEEYRVFQAIMIKQRKFVDGGFMNDVYADGGQIRVGDRFKYDWTDGRTGGEKGYNIVEVIKNNVTSSRDFKTKVMVLKTIESSEPSHVGRIEEDYKPSFKKAIRLGMIVPLQERKAKMVDEFYAKGGMSKFEKLSDKVAKEYEGKPVKSEYQDEYGKVYSKEEAKEVGDKVAGKVKAMQSDKKAFGGLFGGVKSKLTPKTYANLDDKMVFTKDGQALQVVDQSGDTLLVLDANKLGSGVRPHKINISEIDPTSYKTGGQVKAKRVNGGTETLKKANELAKKIRKDGESWLDAKKRAFAQLKK